MGDLMETALAYKGVVVFAWLVLFFVAERFLPAARPLRDDRFEGLPLSRRLLRNATLWFCNLLLSPLIVLQLTYWASEHALAWRPGFYGGWSGLLLDLLVLDLLIYWWHRFNHEWPLLWRFHEIHHLDDFLDSTSALRFHFGEVLISACARAAVIWLLDFPFVSVVVFEALVLIFTIFHHSNLRLPLALEAALSRVIITPGIHWVHHHALRRDTDSNYGTIFSFWDPLFNSRSKARRSPDMRIGVEGQHDRPVLSLLVRPFRLTGSE